MSDLAELLERVKAATGPDRELDKAIVDQFGTYPNGIPLCANIIGIGAFTGSVDNALALVEQMLPGWRYDLHSPRHGQSWEGVVMEHGPSRRICIGHCSTAPLSICAAFLSAKIAEAQP